MDVRRKTNPFQSRHLPSVSDGCSLQVRHCRAFARVQYDGNGPKQTFGSVESGQLL